MTFLFSISTLIFSIVSFAQPVTTFSVSVKRNVAYGPLPEQVVDIFQPQNAPGLSPAFVMIHGGGFHTGDKTGVVTEQNANRLASEGIVVFNINYRLIKNVGQPVPDLHAVNVFPAALEDSQLAVRWVHSQTATYRIEASQLCSWGDSSGGNMAVFLGVRKTIFPGDMAGQLSNYSPMVKCVVDISGSTDLNLQVTSIPGGPAANYVNSKDPAQLRIASPLTYVDGQSAPMAVIHGSQDTTVDPKNATELIEALQYNKVKTLYLPNSGGHVFEGIPLPQRRAILHQAESWALSQVGLTPH